MPHPRRPRARHAQSVAQGVLLAATLFPSPPARAETLEWQPLTAITTTTRAAIERAVGDAADVRVAFVDLDEHSGGATAEDQSEVVVMPAPAACAPTGCRIEILAHDGDAYHSRTYLFGRGTTLEPGTEFRHGLRDLVLDGHRYRFDGRAYRYTGALGAWSRLDEADAATRAWFDAERRRSGWPGERDDPALVWPALVWVAFVELDEVPPTEDRREIIVANHNRDWCGTRGCAVDVYAFDGQGYTQIGGFLGGIIDLGEGFSHGRRDLMLGDVLFRFDGTRYRRDESRPPSSE